MKKLFKGIATALCIGACAGSFALGDTAKALADLTYTTMEELVDRTPPCALILEEEKIKNMTDWGYYNVDGEDVWYFYGNNNGGVGANPEIRFITEGTQTKTKPYTFAPITVDRFSFSYRISNDREAYVDDITSNYIVQILCSDGTYPIIVPEIRVDNAWHTITVDANTPIQNGSGNSFYGQISHLFSGFIFKMGGLDGDFMISNIEVVVDGYAMDPLNPYEEPVAPPCEIPPVEDERDEEDELPKVSALPVESDAPEVSEEEEAPITSEQPSASANPKTSEAPENAQEEGKTGCSSTISGVYAVLTLAGVGVVTAIRKKKE